MSKTERRLGTISLILVAVLVFTALFNVGVGVSVADAASLNPTAMSTGKGNTFVNSNLDFSSIREQYLNHELVQKNTASYDGDRWVIVELEGDTLYDRFDSSLRYNDFSTFANSTEGRKAKANIQTEQAKFLSKLERHNIDYGYKYSYTAITNAVAIKVNAQAYNAIGKMSGVVGVYYSDTYAAPKAVTNNANVYTTGIYDSRDIDYKGEGMVVAILDTGLDRTHEAFQNMPSEKAQSASTFWTKEKVAEKLAAGNLNARGTLDSFYYSEKVPFAYDYSDDDNDVFPSYSSHGTHVAGIVAGKSDYVVNGETGETFIGVAPEAQLMICKVFTDNLDSESLGGADTLDILAAIEDCTTLGVDVINMSLGSSAGFTDEKSDAYINRVYNAVREAGISLVVAASNDYSSGFGGGNGTNLASNPDSGTVGSPSTYPAALSVASINGQKSDFIYANDDINGQVAFITNASDEYGIEYSFIEMLYKKSNEMNGTDRKFGEDLYFKYVPIGGVGRDTNYNQTVQRNLDHARAVEEGYDGTIALVKRGDNTFAEKVRAAMNAGADAIIIYNNVSGTIRMSLGDVNNPIPTCSISMDAGNIIASAVGRRGYGKMTINSTQQAGPFMSEFSSWGPTPSLELRPEITAHGGEITSAIAGGYDKYSGTSMAAPNMAGAVALLRQYLRQKYELEGKELNARVNQVLMSTATIANNEEGNPYSPRKQGAGLAGILDAIEAEGYITVLDPEDETKLQSRDKTKLELFDDPDRNGVYELDFTVHNVTDKAQTYSPYVYVMTETIASDNKTVAEKAYMLNELSTITFESGVDKEHLNEFSGNVTIPANGKLEMHITIELGKDAKKYIDDNFVNGMYVEGFVSLIGVENGQKTLGLPYLAFYGDWTDAPMFDYDTYELAESEKDTNVPDELKLKASAAETRVLGMYYDDDYILPLGTYIYTQDESAVQVYPEREKIAVSIFDDTRSRTIYELYMVYAGLLRGAAYMDIDVTNAATGETLYSVRKENVSKSYAAGGGNRGSFITLEIKPDDPYGKDIDGDGIVDLYEGWSLTNNSTYNVHLNGELDYNYYTDANGVKHGAQASINKQKLDENGNLVTDTEAIRNSFDFQFTVDYESPSMLDYRVRYLAYTDANKETKYRIFLDVDVYDNQYVQTVLPCYTKTRSDGFGGTERVLQLVTEYPIPVYGQKGEVSTVSFEVTDIYEDYVKTGNLFIQVEDYALNSSNYQIVLGYDEYLGAGEDGEIKTPINELNSVFFEEDENLVRDEKTLPKKDGEGFEYLTYNLTLSPNTLYTINAKTLNELGIEEDLMLEQFSWEGENGNRVRAKGNQIFGGQSGSAILKLVNTVSNPKDNVDSVKRDRTYAVINVRIAGNVVNKAPIPESITILPALTGDGNQISLDKTDPVLEVNPGEEFMLKWSVSPWYCVKPAVTWSSANETVATVDQNGKVKTLKRGSTSITVTSNDDDRVRKTVRVVVGSEFRITSYTLYDYYGSGEVVLPDNLNILYLNEDCFKGDTSITKVVLPTTLTEIPENAFAGCTKLEEIVIPGQCTTIKQNAFAGCTSLKTISLGYFVDADHNWIIGPDNEMYYGTLTLGRHAFWNCTSLTKIQMYKGAYNADDAICEKVDSQLRLTTLNDGAFEGCTKLEKIDISQVRVVGKDVFKGCTSLKYVTTSEHTGIGQNMFENCSSLGTFVYKANSVPANAFQNCESLSNFTFENSVTSIGAGAFINTAIENIVLPSGKVSIANGAFQLCGELTTVTLSAGTVLEFTGSSPFAGCDNFVEFAIQDGSVYEVVDGLLYSADKKTLVAVPYAKKNIVLASEVENIGDGAFAGVGAIESPLDLSNVKYIGKYAFASSSVTAVILPSNLTAIPEGLFSGCTKLESVTAADNFAKVTKVGDNAFRNCVSLKNISLENVTEIGNCAFQDSALEALPGAKIAKVGASAFEGTSLSEVKLVSAAEISLGTRAFANISALRTVEFGKVIYMGSGMFIGSYGITEATFGDGTEKIGDFAFNSEDGNRINTRITVNLPDSVTEIGSYAFYRLTNLSTINLKNVKYIYEAAFYETHLTNTDETDLSSVIEIWPAAFAYTWFSSVNLENAEYIGNSAFFDVNENEATNKVKLTSVTFGALQIIGENAFSGTKLTSVKLPASFDSRTYNYTWIEYDEKGREITPYKTRKEAAYGIGAFAAISTLEKFEVEEGNDIFFAHEGVLYSKVENGYVLEQYPTVKPGTEYSVLSGTVVIRDSAFHSVELLTRIELPYTVKVIGSDAFYASSVTDYTFNSVEAPILLATYIPEAAMADDTMFQIIFSRGYYGTNEYYANFSDYVILCDKDQLFDLSSMLSGILAASDFELTARIPLNARGYNRIWGMFFSTIEYSDEIMADDTTHKANEAIDALIAEVGDKDIATLSAEQVKEDSEIGRLARAARTAYNQVMDTAQLAFLAENFEKLVDIESALRERKRELNLRVVINELKINSSPSKTIYSEGEKFDLTGLSLTAVYNDGSEVVLEGDTLDMSRLTLTAAYTDGTETVLNNKNPILRSYTIEKIVIGYKDGDSVAQAEILIKVQKSDAPIPNENNGLDKNTIIAIAVAVPAAVLIVVAVVLIVVLKKKKAAAGNKEEQSVSENESANGTSENEISAQESESADEASENVDDVSVSADEASDNADEDGVSADGVDEIAETEQEETVDTAEELQSDEEQAETERNEEQSEDEDGEAEQNEAEQDEDNIDNI